MLNEMKREEEKEGGGGFFIPLSWSVFFPSIGKKDHSVAATHREQSESGRNGAREREKEKRSILTRLRLKYSAALCTYLCNIKHKPFPPSKSSEYHRFNRIVCAVFSL